MFRAICFFTISLVGCQKAVASEASEASEAIAMCRNLAEIISRESGLTYNQATIDDCVSGAKQELQLPENERSSMNTHTGRACRIAAKTWLEVMECATKECFGAKGERGCKASAVVEVCSHFDEL